MSAYIPAKKSQRYGFEMWVTPLMDDQQRKAILETVTQQMIDKIVGQRIDGEVHIVLEIFDGAAD